MKKPLSILIITLLASTPVVVQAGQNAEPNHDHASDALKISRKLTNISGKVGSEGKTFTADKDKKIWVVGNPTAVSGIDGRHVRVKAQLDSVQNQIRIVSVRAIAENQAGIKLDDAAFRR